MFIIYSGYFRSFKTTLFVSSVVLLFAFLNQIYVQSMKDSIILLSHHLLNEQLNHHKGLSISSIKV